MKGGRSLPGEENGEEAFLEVEAVFGLLEDDGLWAIDNFVGDFDAAVGGEAVHDDGVTGGEFEQVGVDLVGGEDGEALGFFSFLTHADPGVGVDDVGILEDVAGFAGGGEIEIGGLAHHTIEEGGFEFEAGGRGDAEFNLEAGAGDHEGAGHVVAVADVGEGFSVEAAGAEVFFDGEEIGHGLAGVGVIGEAVDDGDGGELGEALEFIVLEDAGHDGVGHAGEDACDIGDGFAGAEADFGGGDVEGVSAHVVHGGFEGDAGAEGGFFEDAGEDFAGGDGVIASGGLELFFETFGDVEDVYEGLLGGVGDGDEVEFGHNFHHCSARKIK